MSLKLYLHPLASFCQKVVMALYENQTPFEPVIIDLADPGQRAALVALWPMAKFPVLRDEARGQTIPESTIIIEYLEHYFPGPVALLPRDPEAALEVRLQDRFFDLYLEEPMQKIVTDKLRPAGQHDPRGVDDARAQLRTAYGALDHVMAKRTWAAGAAFTMADCSAAPALFYAHKVEPLNGDAWPHASAYMQRLLARPSWLRVLDDAQPYFAMFPG